MDTTTGATAPDLQAELLRIARKYEELGAQEAASTPYWAPCPATVVTFRAVARALRAEVGAV
ncbi:hypothetical protein [Nocardioides sp. J54]|uniref:hypothetical protein n=1 Tax=Nocardioides sp. J54 TaxID=935866 RepID=UPI00048D3D95|nr:hypothetical protein [Nocardioides sp. J54]